MIRSALILTTLLLAWPAQARDTGLADLKTTLRELSKDPRIQGARLGIVARDLDSGKDVIRMRPTEKFNVASVTKLLTSAAALSRLGPEFRFKTVMYARKVEGDAVQGDLYVKGFGDPTLAEGGIWQMVQQLYDRGVRRVTGGLVIDESHLDALRDPPLFETRDTDMYYRPTTGALSVGRNILRVMVRGGARKGDPAMVLLEPRSSHFRAAGKVATTSRGGRSRIRVKAAVLADQGGVMQVSVKGKVRPRGLRQVARLRVEDPGMAAGRAFLDALALRGIALGRPGIKRAAIPKKKPQVLAWWRSAPLTELLHTMNKKSDNFMAEQLLKVMGAETVGLPGSSAGGLRAVKAYLARVGLAPGSYELKNGSGLYEASSLSPVQVVTVLRYALRDFKTGPDLAASLAIGGVDGTLRRRQRETAAERYVRAKTGTLSGVVSLAGMSGGSARRPMVFAAFINDLPEGKVGKGRAVLDDVAAALVTYLER